MKKFRIIVSVAAEFESVDIEIAFRTAFETIIAKPSDHLRFDALTRFVLGNESAIAQLDGVELICVEEK